MTKPFIACYKAYRGGEWFELSLESIRPHTDGAVVVFSGGPWLESLVLPENCSEPLARFRSRHPEYPVVVVEERFSRQEDQYAAGLAAIRKSFGRNAAVLVIDTDEVWDPSMVTQLRKAVNENPLTRSFRSRIWSYLKSPLYRVYPIEGPDVLVALQDAMAESVKGRCAVGGSTLRLPDICFHHFCYVRNNEQDVREKFHNTSSQEDTPSKTDWFRDVWPALPLGTNLHMTPGCERVWKEIKISTPEFLPAGVHDLPFVADIIEREDYRWRHRLRQTLPADQLLPIPTWDRHRYQGDLRSYLGPVDLELLESRIQTSYLEALNLAHWASEVPPLGRIVEVGCGHGATTTILAGASPRDVVVDAVDPFVAYDEHALTLVRDVMEGDEREFWDTLRHYGVTYRVNHLMKHSSDTRLYRHLSCNYNLVFVDANHTYDNVKHDLRLFWPRVKPGGLLVGHDYTTRFPGVIRAADEFPIDFLTVAGTSLFYARKKA